MLRWVARGCVSDRGLRAPSRMGRRALAGLAVVAIVAAGIAAVAARADAADIFEVDLKHCITLHVGYKYFPAQTVIRWTVSQRGAVVATGQFVTGDGAGYHFFTTRMRPGLSPDSGARASFAATVQGREFRYAIGRGPVDPRKPACVRSRVTQSSGIGSIGRPNATIRTGNGRGPSSPLAVTGNGPGARFGVGLVLMGAAFLVIARPPSRRAKTRHRRRPASWLYITPVP